MKRMTPPRYPLLLAAALLLLTGPGVAPAGKLYRWVDAQGNVHYSDRVPPEQIRQGREELDPQGRIIRSVERAKTREELEAAQREAEKKAEQERQARQRAQRDRVLLQTYTSLDDIQRSRTRKINAIEATIRVTQGRIEKLEAELGNQMKIAADAERRGEAVPDEIKQAIASLRQQIADNRNYITAKRGDMAQLEKSYAADIKRYKELKGLP